MRSEATGIDFVNRLEVDHPMGYLYRSGMACGALVVGDVDGDGRPDLFCTGGPGPNRLYRQSGDLVFEDITNRSPELDGGERWASGAAFADVDGDGDLDLYVCAYQAPNRLFLNDGTGAFALVPDALGLAVVDASHTPAFADYDRDGDLDLYLLTNRIEDTEGYRGEEALEWRDGRPAVKPSYQDFYTAWFEDADHWGIQADGRADFLFRNDAAESGEPGARRFVDVSEEAGISGRADGNSVTWWDFDNDGWPDLHVGNDFIGPDRLYRNNGDGTFTDVMGDVAPHTAWFSMGVDAGDLDNDGWLDLLVADMSATNHFKQKTTMGVMGGDILRRANESRPPQYMRNALLIGTDAGRFLEGAFIAGLDSTDWTWAVKFGDFDNDGLQDVYFTNGTARAMNDSDLTLTNEQLEAKHEWEYVKHFPPRRERNLAFRNRGEWRFDDVSDAWGLGHEGVSYAAATADFDRDGDLDLVVANVDEEVSFFRNDAAAGRGLLVRLVGTRSNRWGIGARLEVVTADGTRQLRELFPDRGFMSGDDPVAHFGTGDAESVDRLTVRWPSGTVQTLRDVATGGLVTVTEPEEAGEAGAEGELAAESDPPAPLLAASGRALFPALPDVPQDDFARQPLLPNTLSALGPGAAWGDVDGDGDDDLYLGGAAGHAGALWKNLGRGRFAEEWIGAFREDAACEDMGSVFFDADADGDLDLYVVGGSYEFGPTAPELRDRLYLNATEAGGPIRFEPAPAGSLPDVRDAGGVAAAADFDRDGDLDLFVGGRVVPGRYPVTPASRLLVNEGGVFEEATGARAPALAEAGLVTGAVWSDADGDGWIDLLVAVEWGPVRFFRNREGRLEEATAEAGLAERTGWWNSIAARDLDRDGDIDYVVGNTGHNTKYHHPTPERPVSLYYGDYAGDGVKRLVEAEFEGDILYPVRGKSCSTRAMPHLAEKFRTFREFAAATLEEIYPASRLDDSLRLEANCLESGVLINDGSARFRFEPLPHLAQISPIFGLALEDVDLDGTVDIVAAQNFFGPQPETGRFDGGVGQVLRGDGMGSFTLVTPGRSGFVVPGDATALAVADANEDGRPDFLVARNDDRPLLFENRSPLSSPCVAVRLKGPAGNTGAVGARVVLRRGAEAEDAVEITAGAGYLSQSAPVAFFGLPERGGEVSVEVRWPDGSAPTRAAVDPGGGSVLLVHPSAESAE